MSLFVFRQFGGEIPRLAETLLPENAAQDAANCDLAHGELRGMRGDDHRYTASSMGSPVKAVYTEDGVYFFGWAYDTHAVRSMVQGDIHYRLYYTQVLEDGPIAKVARTFRNDSGSLTRIIGGLAPNFYPPESTGADAWILGVLRPKVQADIEQDNLVATLVDKGGWPDAPKLRLRVTVFYEDPTGKIVQQYDASNNEAAISGTSVYDNVFYTNNSADRGNKIQDMLWPLGYQRRPYKYYWFIPKPIDLSGLAKPVLVTNAGPADAMFTYDSVTPDPTDPPPPVGVA